MENDAKGKIEMNPTNEFTEIVRLIEMKQFYETYFLGSECFKLWLEDQGTVQPSQIVSPPATQIKTDKKTDNPIVSPVATQLQVSDNKHNKFMSTLLTQITWTNHMEILSGGKTPEEKLFYLLLSAKDKLNKLELRRQIKTASFERTMLAKNQNKIVTTLPTQFPTGVFKDPYIFEFLDLPEVHSEKDLEKALTQNLRKFIIEINYFKRTN